MTLNTREMWSNDIKKLFFQKVTKNCKAGSFAPRLPSMMRLSYTGSANTSPKLAFALFNYWF